MTTIYSTNHQLSNCDDVLDSRDIISALEDAINDAIDEYATWLDNESEFSVDEGMFEDIPQSWLDEVCANYDDIKALQALCEEGESFADWQHGETLIHDSYFAQYAEELAHDLGLVSGEMMDWPLRHIDWQAAAEELQMDYSTIDFDGQTYWIRS